MKVININGTSDTKCKCGSWLEHWVKYGGKKVPDLCPVRRCNHKPTVGAHVQKNTLTDKNWYIIPLCHQHNMSTVSLDLYDDTHFAVANKSETCEKSTVFLRVQK